MPPHLTGSRPQARASTAPLNVYPSRFPHPFPSPSPLSVSFTPSRVFHPLPSPLHPLPTTHPKDTPSPLPLTCTPPKTHAASSRTYPGTSRVYRGRSTSTWRIGDVCLDGEGGGVWWGRASRFVCRVRLFRLTCTTVVLLREHSGSTGPSYLYGTYVIALLSEVKDVQRRSLRATRRIACTSSTPRFHARS